MASYDCKHCGWQIKGEEARFCSHCGAPTTDATTVTQAAPDRTPPGSEPTGGLEPQPAPQVVASGSGAMRGARILNAIGFWNEVIGFCISVLGVAALIAGVPLISPPGAATLALGAVHTLAAIGLRNLLPWGRILTTLVWGATALYTVQSAGEVLRDARGPGWLVLVAGTALPAVWCVIVLTMCWAKPGGPVFALSRETRAALLPRPLLTSAYFWCLLPLGLWFMCGAAISIRTLLF